MESLTASQAFSMAPPRSAAVLCLKGPDGSTDLITTEWFTWLNLKRQPMISFSMVRSASLGLDLKTDDALVLAFPPRQEAEKYRAGVRTARDGQDKPLPVEVCSLPDVCVQVPADSEVLLKCTLAGAYNYPFKKVRIFNCNLEEALGEPESEREP